MTEPHRVLIQWDRVQSRLVVGALDVTSMAFLQRSDVDAAVRAVAAEMRAAHTYGGPDPAPGAPAVATRLTPTAFAAALFRRLRAACPGEAVQFYTGDDRTVAMFGPPPAQPGRCATTGSLSAVCSCPGCRGGRARDAQRPHDRAMIASAQARVADAMAARAAEPDPTDA